MVARPSDITVKIEDRVRAYATAVVPELLSKRDVSVTRFEAGDRHEVYRVSCLGTIRGTRDAVVRLATRNDLAERTQAENEAAVLAKLNGVGAPALYDFRTASEWFDGPVMCMEFIDGDRRELAAGTMEDLESLGAVTAAIHARSTDDLVDRLGGARTLGAYIDDRIKLNRAYRSRLQHPLPPAVQAKLDAGFSFIDAAREWARRADSFQGDHRLVLLHGDIGQGNILWTPAPVLIDWEYARLGDPADEIAYIYGQHGLTADRRAALHAGYGAILPGERLDHLDERVRWWEPVLLLGSVLWWLERWAHRAASDASGARDTFAPKNPRHYLEQATIRLDRLHDAIRQSPACHG